MPFTSTDANVEPLRICKTIYLPTPFIGIFLIRDLTPMETWTLFCGAIVNGGIVSSLLDASYDEYASYEYRFLTYFLGSVTFFFRLYVL